MKKTVSSSAELFSQHLGLAEVISLEYTNIPGALPSEALSEAHQALFRASEAFDSSRGEFTPYAAKSVRNALNSFYAKSLRLANIFPKSLDAAPDWNHQHEETSAITFGEEIRDTRQNVLVEVRRRETTSVLEEILRFLSPRERVVVEGMRSGKSLSEIGEMMEISKQATHKISTSALEKLRERLAFLGYQGLDSQGLLKSLSSRKSEGG